MPFYVYLLKCNDDTLYCGYTTNLDKRLNAHNTGKGAKYTKSRRPVTLVWFEECESKSAALKKEWAVKRLTRKQKLVMIHNGDPQRCG